MIALALATIAILAVPLGLLGLACLSIASRDSSIDLTEAME